MLSRWIGFTLIAMLGILTGCNHVCRKGCTPVGPIRPVTGGNIILPTPVPPAPQPVPSPFPVTPTPSFSTPRPIIPGETPPPPIAPVGPVGPDTSARIRSPELLLPEERINPVPGVSPPPAPPPFDSRSNKPADAPAVTEGSFSLGPVQPATPGATPSRPGVVEGPIKTEPAPSSSGLPVDIAGFAVVKGQTAAGRRPGIEGHDWLKATGYKAVLHLKRPGEDDSTDRKAAESRGLRYLTLEVSATTLTPALAEAFHRAVDNSEYQPLFVYDRDGELAGALWYIHLKHIDGYTEEQARAKATRLGLRGGEIEQVAAKLPANRP